jgi:hypothetical protein
MSPEPSFRLYVLEVGTYNPFGADRLAGDLQGPRAETCRTALDGGEPENSCGASPKL